MENIRYITIVGGEDGNPSRFTTLIEPIKLDYDAEMAITSLYHGQIFNIHSGNNKVYFYAISDELPLGLVKLHRGTLKTQDPRTSAAFGSLPEPDVVIVPEGNYKSSIALILTISDLIKNALGFSKRRDVMHPAMDKYFGIINVDLLNLCLIVEGKQDTPWDLLRVYDDKLSKSFTIEERDFTSDSPAFVYANIIENSYINGKLSRNMGVVPIKSTSEWSFFEPTHPHYVPINVKEFSKILIELRDMKGQYMRFNPRSKTVLCLRIRAIKRV